MTRLDAEAAPVDEGRVECDGPRALLLPAREVPLGGVRGMAVHRSLPQRDLPMIGAWCFLDRFGPQITRMRVEPHPHIGLQTVTWPLTGEIRHRDSIGSDVVIRPGQLNLMTSGAGIAHSEYSVGEEAAPLDALQLWIALPESRRHGEPAFEQVADLPVVMVPAGLDGGGAARVTVVMGAFADAVSPATAHTPLVGAEVHLPPGAHVRLPLQPGWEYGLLGVEGTTSITTPITTPPSTSTDTLSRTVLAPQRLLYLGLGRDGIEVMSDEGATLFLIGGAPFDDDIVMWWNFVARSHEEIIAARDAWESTPARDAWESTAARDARESTPAPRFGHVVGHGGERIPAPPLPRVRLTQRRRRV